VRRARAALLLVAAGACGHKARPRPVPIDPALAEKIDALPVTHDERAPGFDAFVQALDWRVTYLGTSREKAGPEDASGAAELLASYVNETGALPDAVRGALERRWHGLGSINGPRAPALRLLLAPDDPGKLDSLAVNVDEDRGWCEGEKARFPTTCEPRALLAELRRRNSPLADALARWIGAGDVATIADTKLRLEDADFDESDDGQYFARLSIPGLPAGSEVSILSEEAAPDPGRVDGDRVSVQLRGWRFAAVVEIRRLNEVGVLRVHWARSPWRLP
jgi:hypothetical protein